VVCLFRLCQHLSCLTVGPAVNTGIRVSTQPLRQNSVRARSTSIALDTEGSNGKEGRKGNDNNKKEEREGRKKKLMRIRGVSSIRHGPGTADTDCFGRATNVHCIVYTTTNNGTLAQKHDGEIAADEK
jgi:hypothetical protein